jgi:hypothetical protein
VSVLGYLAGSLGVVSLGFAALAWYYRGKLRAAQESLNRLVEAGASWKALHDMQVKQLGALQRALADRQVKESENDKATAHAASGNAADAAALLNQLHKDGNRPSASVPAAVRPGTSPGVSGRGSKGVL